MEPRHELLPRHQTRPNQTQSVNVLKTSQAEAAAGLRDYMYTRDEAGVSASNIRLLLSSYVY